MDILSDLYLILIQPPGATIFILFVSIGLNLLSIWATNRFTDVKQMQENMEEVKAWREKFNEARKTMDPLLLEEVMAQQQRIMRINADMMGARCKPYLIFIIPFFTVFSLLGQIFSLTSLINISAAVPGMLSKPASLSIESVSLNDRPAFFPPEKISIGEKP